LCDSGGQYIDGTTDITRTIALAEPSNIQKKHYTLVLKGHIALDSMHYPEGTTGSQLDTLARQYLWQCGLNYGHGTGHGVGYFLNVHEPPQGYSPGSASRATTALQEGMLSSNEPGYYADGQYGIRIENLILVEKSQHEGFLRHRTMSFFPIDTTLIDKSLLTNEEINWLNQYHDQVLEKLGPQLDESHLAWLKLKCSKI
jgi:Xaa-Pro aminopeptidase